MGRINQRLNGLNPLSYLGENSYQPPEFVTDNRAPVATDVQNFQLGTIWLNITNNPPGAEDVWMLVSQYGGSATWVNFAGGTAMETLTGNSGGPVSGDVNDNINILGDTTTINIAGNPGTNTLTVSTVGTGVVSTLTGNSGGAVSPLAGNINVVGSGVITVVGNPGTHTLTVTPSGAIASSFPTDSGTATPALGVLTIRTNQAALASGSSVLFSGSGSTVTLSVTDASSNTIVGNNAGNLTLSGSNNTGLGKTVLHALTTANANTVIGSLSGALITTGANNIIIGESSGTTFTTGASNIIIGQNAGNALAGAEGTNTLIGHTGIVGTSNLIVIAAGSSGTQFIHNFGSGNGFFGTAGNFTLTTGSAINNTGVGNTSLAALTTGASNVGVGAASLQSCTTGSNNAAFGPASMQLVTSSSSNVGVGGGTLAKLATGSGQNTAIGFQAGDNLLTGTANTLVGSGAGTNYAAAESNNIVIGTQTATVGDSGVIRIGNNGGTTVKCFISGIRGITTGVNDAVAVLVDSANQLGTVSSSARFKENIEDMADHSSALLNLRPVVFNYKDDVDKNRQTGLIAEEVLEEMPNLVVYGEDELPLTIKYHELGPLLLNELQKLSNRVLDLELKLSKCCKE